MRDIRQDLRERLTRLEQNRDRLQAELRAIDDEAAALTRLLDFEDHRFPAGNNQDQKPERPTRDFILDAVKARPLTKKEIKAALERAGYGQNGSAGRVAHLALVNLTKKGEVILGPDRRYGLPPAPPHGSFSFGSYGSAQSMGRGPMS